MTSIIVILAFAIIGWHIGSFIDLCIKRPDIAKRELHDVAYLLASLILLPLAYAYGFIAGTIRHFLNR